MYKIAFKRLAKTKAKASEVEGHVERQRGFIVILLLLIILIFVMTPVGCATLLALLTGTGAAAP